MEELDVELALLPVVAEGPDAAVGYEPTVDDRPAVDHSERVLGRGDDALDEVLLGVLGVLEDNHVPTLRRQAGEEALVGEGQERAVGGLVHEDVIADEQRRDHRAARDLEGLDHEAAQEQGDPDRNRNRLAYSRISLAPAREVLADEALGAAVGLLERSRGERLDQHRALEILQAVAQVVALGLRELLLDVAPARLEDPARLLEQGTRLVVARAQLVRHVPPTAHARGAGERELVPERRPRSRRR